MTMPASRAQKALLIAGAVLLLLVVAFSVPWKLNLVRDNIAQRVEAATGRAFAVEGDIWWRWWGGRLTAERLRFANPPWAGRPQMITAEKLDATIELLPLLRDRRLVVRHVQVLRPDLWLETTADGRFNARLDREQKEERSGVDLGVVELDQGLLHFVQKHRDTEMQVRLDNNAGQGAAANKLAAKATGRWRGLAATAQGVGDPVLRLRDTTRPYALEVTIAVGETRLKGVGTITGLAHPTAADLKIQAEGASLGEWYRIVSVGLPSTPAYRTQGHVRLVDRVWYYEEFTGRVGNSDLAGKLRFEHRPARPFIGGTLVSQRLDLHDFLPIIGKKPPPPTATAPKDKQGRKPPPPKATKAPSATLLPQWTFSAEKWDTLDADVQFDGKSIVNVGKAPFDGLKMHVKLDDRQLALDPLQFAFAGGSLAGKLAIDGRRQPMAARVDLSGRGLHLEQLLPLMNNKRLAFGTANAKVALAGRGNSFGQMLSNADGEAQMAMGSGQISNLLLEIIDLDGQEALGFLIRGDQPVPVRCALIDVGMKDGLMSARNMVFDTNDTIIEASGRADFKNEQLDLRIKPVAKDFSLATLRVPFDMKGPFKQPKISPDKGRLALRAGAALALGAVTPLAALIALIETGPGKDADCNALVARAKSEGVPVKNELPAGRPRDDSGQR